MADLNINTYNLKLQEIDRQIAAVSSLKCQINIARPQEYSSCMINKDRTLHALINQRKIVVTEMEKEQQYLKDEYFKQKQQETEQARQATLLAEQEVEQAKNKSEQEKKIAEQQLQRAKSLEAIAKQSEGGNFEAMRISQGMNTVNKYKTPFIITGVTIGVLALVFIGYKVLKKAKKV